jgi:hypothetical protein
MVKSYSSMIIFPSWEGTVLATYNLPLVLSCSAMAISPTLSLNFSLHLRLIVSNSTTLTQAMAPLCNLFVNLSLSLSLDKDYCPVGWLLSLFQGSLNPLSRLSVSFVFTWPIACTHCSSANLPKSKIIAC